MIYNSDILSGINNLSIFFFILLTPETGERSEKERERSIDQLPPGYAPTWDQTPNPGMCPDWESHPQPFGW